VASVAQKLSLVFIFVLGVFFMAYGMRLLLKAPASSPNYMFLLTPSAFRYVSKHQQNMPLL